MSTVLRHLSCLALFWQILKQHEAMQKQCAKISRSTRESTSSTPCLKKNCQLIFSFFSVKYEPISIKLGRIVPIPKETLNKTVSRMSTSPKVCACTTLGNLKCQIELSTQ